MSVEDNTPDKQQPKPSIDELRLIDAMQESFDELREPRIDRVLQAARAASDIMQIIPSTPTEQFQVIDDLDRLWMENGTEQTILVRGKIKYEVKTPKGKEMREAILWDSEVISNGFTVEGLTEIDHDDHTRLGKVMHFLTVPSSSVPEKFKKNEIIATAELDVIVDTNEASTERAYTWLKAMYPEFVEEVDKRVIACESETDVILALRDIVIGDWIDTSNPRARNCVEAFLGAYVVVDTEAPYGILCDGKVAIINDSYGLQSLFDIENVDTLAEISQPRLFKTSESDEDPEWVLGIFIETEPQDLSVTRIKYAVPLITIDDIKSIRRMYYSR